MRSPERLPGKTSVNRLGNVTVLEAVPFLKRSSLQLVNTHVGLFEIMRAASGLSLYQNETPTYMLSSEHLRTAASMLLTDALPVSVFP